MFQAAETTSPQSLLPLESLTFLVNSTSPRAVTNWPLLLNLLAATNLKALHLARFFPVDVTASQIPLKTVTTLTMTGEIRLREAVSRFFSVWTELVTLTHAASAVILAAVSILSRALSQPQPSQPGGELVPAYRARGTQGSETVKAGFYPKSRTISLLVPDARLPPRNSCL